jgi:hypothetical protein
MAFVIVEAEPTSSQAIQSPGSRVVEQDGQEQVAPLSGHSRGTVANSEAVRQRARRVF